MDATVTRIEAQGLDAGSFRDRRGRVFYHEGKVYRWLDAAALADWKKLTSAKNLQSRPRRLVETREVDAPIAGVTLPEGGGLLWHERLPLITYPYEWCFSMLRDAALQQLELLLDACKDGMVLRDATPYNTQWHGASPVFIDIPSFGTGQKGAPWVAYRQFCKMFLYPLMLQSHFGVPFQPWLRGSLDGIEPQDMARLSRFGDILRPGVFSHVWLQAALGSVESKASGNRLNEEFASLGEGNELVVALGQKLTALVNKLKWKEKASRWADYAQKNTYTDADQKTKEAFVERACQREDVDIVWDMGANTGHYSALAARHASLVVSMDSDHLAVERHYLKLKAQLPGGGRILPLVFNLADPSPSLGWRNAERKCLPERQRPDLCLCLAVIHHLVLSANIVLEDLVEWLAQTTPHLVIEWVGRDDPMVIGLLRNKEDIYTDYSLEGFEAALNQRFEVLNRETLPSGTRILFEAKRRSP